MKKLGKTLITIIIVSMIFSMLVGNSSSVGIINASVITREPVKIAVLVYDVSSNYMSEVIESLKDIQKENEGKVEFTFFSSDFDQDKQNVVIDTIVKKNEFALLLVALADINRSREVIDKGFMTGTVIQDARGMADALYATGMNLVAKKKPLEDTQYKFDDTGVSIRIPYQRYVPN